MERGVLLVQYGKGMHNMSEKKVYGDVVLGSFGSIGSVNQIHQLNKKNIENNLNKLNQESFILFSLLYTPLSISDLHERFISHSLITLKGLSYKMKREDRGTGLLFDGLVSEIEDQGKKKYKITAKGEEQLKSSFLELLRGIQEEQSIKHQSIFINNQIGTAKEFLEENQGTLILAKEEGVLWVDFRLLQRFEPTLAEQILDNPEETLKLIKISADSLDEDLKNRKYSVRVRNLPQVSEKNIAELRSSDMGRMVMVRGTVVTLTSVSPRINSARFECPACGNVFNVLASPNKFQEPEKCGCGRKGKFINISQELLDIQSILLEELSQDLNGRSQAQTMRIILDSDLCGIGYQQGFESGTPIEISGVWSSFAQEKKVELATFLRANSLSFEANTSPIKIDSKVEEQIKQFLKEPNREKRLLDSFAHHVKQRDTEKKILLLSLVSGGNSKSDARDDMHILMFGDPGTAKSELLEYAEKISPPPSRRASGKGTSGVGLIGSVVKDELLGTWAVKKGVLPLANGGVVLIDELDKMGVEDRAAMHEAMENQYVHLNKAGKSAKFSTDCTIIAAANPTMGRFDRSMPLHQQIDLPATLINRFDLIVPFVDFVGEKDAELTMAILNRSDKKKPELSEEFIRSYIYYVRTQINPKLTEEAKKILASNYNDLRARSEMALPINPRTLEALIRSSTACAKLRGSSSVEEIDAQEAIDLLMMCLEKMEYIEKGVLR